MNRADYILATRTRRFSICLQSAPYTPIVHVSTFETADRAAQMIADGRHAYLLIRDECDRTRKLYAPKAPERDPFRTYHARQDIRTSRQFARLQLERFKAFNISRGRALARAMATFRQLFEQYQPGFVRLEKRGNEIRAILTSGESLHVATASWFERENAQTTVRRDFETVYTRPDGRFAGGLVVSVTAGDWHAAVHTGLNLQLVA